MKKTFAKLLLISIVLFYFPCVNAKTKKAVQTEKIEVQLSKCVDGDTATFTVNGDEKKVRFLAIDTPESVHPKKKKEPFGKEASDFTCSTLKSAQKIEIQYDANSEQTDKYGRLLAWVWVDDVLLEQLLLKNGYAKVAYIYGSYSYLDDLCQEEKNAIDNSLGIWSINKNTDGYCTTIDYADGKLLSLVYYTVTFKSKDKEVVKKVKANEKIKTLTPSKKDGFIFKGWYLGSQKYDFSQSVTGDLTLTAEYSIDYKYLIALVGVLIISMMVKTTKKGRKKWKK